ncbi:ELMO/CED-12 family-domain-containing protein [Syncephalastrum racemosum]|uniref:ELMO/CED-12 family-domain-containing protein n=1 Tax=Syncephalastrum racemosum TaxID=13706 RepID=A0A1X2HKL2_SYNRA|nr:ELMO/CED-12 family-domain-containing protein [Syncephalastrum racemosum]
MSWLWLFILDKIYASSFLLTIYRAYKRVVRVVLHTTELDRLCNEAATNAQKKRPRILGHVIYRIDQSITYSKALMPLNTQLRDGPALDGVIAQIATRKQVRHRDILETSLRRIVKIRALASERTARARTAFVRAQHQPLLDRLWTQLMPNARQRDWTAVGFQQASSPATDFRGMGCLGLDQLVYFAEHYPDHARECILQDTHPHWYPFAIVGIHVSQLVLHALQQRQLQLYLCTGFDFDELFCSLFYQFHQFWVDRRLNVMQFEAAFIDYKAQVQSMLKTHTALPFQLYLDHLEREKASMEDPQEDTTPLLSHGKDQ